MDDERIAEQSRLIEGVIDRAGKATQDAVFDTFARQYLDLAPLEALRSRDEATLLALIERHYKASATLQAPWLAVRPPAKGERLAAVEVVSAEMPFLVDSLSMAIRNTGSAIDWLIHPVMRVQRGDDGQRSGIEPRDSSAGREETCIQIAFEPLADDEAYAELERRIRQVIDDLQAVVGDYVPMRRRVQTIIAELKYPGPGCDTAQFEEAQAFLEWLDDNHFTYLGFKETRLRDGGDSDLENVPDSGLGLLRDQAQSDGVAPYVAPPSEMQKYIGSSRLVVITKSAARSHIHHPEYMDSVSIKHYDERGEVVGTYRLLGLFSSSVYTSNARSIPIVRRKLEWVLARTRLPEHSHASKTIRDIFESLPRDELLQGSEHELYDIALGIRALKDRQQLRLFLRRDRYGRFFSAMVYMPRDRYGWAKRQAMSETLTELFDAQGIEHSVQFLRDGYARIHFFVRTEPGTEIELSNEAIEQRLVDATRTWRDSLAEALEDSDLADQTGRLLARYGDAFPASYTDSVPAVDAVKDIRSLETLLADDNTTQLPQLLAGHGCEPHLRLYVRGEPVTLSDVLPTLENFGLRVHNHAPHKLSLDQQTVWVQDFACELDSTVCPATDDALPTELFADAFRAVDSGQAENDAINRLVIGSGMDWRRVALVRTLAKYLLQTDLPFSQGYLAEILAGHGDIARLLVDLFAARFDPDGHDDAAAESLGKELAQALDAVQGLDADRALRGALDVVNATLRTNYYQQDDNGQPKAWISLKLKPANIPELPKPLPHIETFVYAPEVEGIHLRGGPVARGGLRWSDRREDFRTEVLGLMKAQMVKNAVIVPVGAKGGFVVKRRIPPGNRDAFRQAGVDCYKTFIRGLLDITDNRVGDAIEPPPRVVRLDDDDPYLVVAADKGTATFSDIANGISADYGFWLGDAFASGGAAGYDHKKMGITARSAWESVKRHFREMDRDTQSEDFTVVGIGDMAGDVFGNGMLLSKHIRLIAAFNHLHIFIDPAPDAARSFEERKRLFEQPRSAWTDYDAGLISDGGGVFERSAKRIELSAPAAKALGVEPGALRPDEVIRAILRAPVDLLWNGGIGTYVKAREEAHADVGDRANDALRLNAEELRCKVIGEGGNLGLTQRGRIAFAQHGGRLNTDAIDNVGGVASSDLEVNIKIPLNGLLQDSSLAEDDRNALLASATEDVAELVLRSGYEQGRAISVMEAFAGNRLDEHANLMRILERKGLLDRAIEFLPSEDVVAERKLQSVGLTRPEIAVLLSYSKIALYQALLDGELPDDESLETELMDYFPAAIREAHEDPIRHHRLRRDLIATVVTNQLVNTMGMAFPHRLAEEQGVSLTVVARAFLMAVKALKTDALMDAIEALDGQLAAATQYALMTRVTGLIKHGCNWFLGTARQPGTIAEAVDTVADDVAAIAEALPDCLPSDYRKDWDKAVKRHEKAGAPAELARAIANTRVLGTALDMARLRQQADEPLEIVTDTFLAVGEELSVLWLHGALNALSVTGRWPALARATLRDDVYRLHALIAEHVLTHPGDNGQARYDDWAKDNRQDVDFARARMQEIRSADATDFPGLSVAVRELRKLRLMR